MKLKFGEKVCCSEALTILWNIFLKCVCKNYAKEPISANNSSNGNSKLCSDDQCYTLGQNPYLLHPKSEGNVHGALNYLSCMFLTYFHISYTFHSFNEMVCFCVPMI